MIIKNMRALAAVKRGSLGYSFLVITRRRPDGTRVTNVDEIAAGAELAKEIGCDYFEVKPEYDLGHFLRSQPDDVVDELKSQVSEAHRLADEHFQVLSPRHLQDVIDQTGPIQPKSYDTCAVAELRTLITPSGAFMCPYHRGRESACYGDPTTQSFSSLWRGAVRSEVVSRINPSLECQFNCIRHQSNLRIAEIREAGSGVAVEDFDPFL